MHRQAQTQEDRERWAGKEEERKTGGRKAIWYPALKNINQSGLYPYKSLNYSLRNPFFKYSHPWELVLSTKCHRDTAFSLQLFDRTRFGWKSYLLIYLVYLKMTHSYCWFPLEVLYTLFTLEKRWSLALQWGTGQRPWVRLEVSKPTLHYLVSWVTYLWSKAIEIPYMKPIMKWTSPYKDVQRHGIA